MNLEEVYQKQRDHELILNNEDLVRRYEKAKDELEVSLRLYRLVIIHDIGSEAPKMHARVKKAQAVYEKLYRCRFSFS